MVLVALSLIVLLPQHARADSRGPATRVVTDMAGRKVTLPMQIKSIATVGPVPVLNGFIFVFGDGDKIVNGLPKQLNHKYQSKSAPSLATKPILQGSSNGLNLEELLRLSPDVAFTMDRGTVDVLQRNGIATIYLSWRNPEDLKRLVRLVGEVLNKPAVAEEYVRYFDDTVKRVAAAESRIPRGKRPRVLSFNVKTLTQDHLIAEWWIEAAGGISVTNNGRSTESYTFSMEQVLAWNPDVMIVNSSSELTELYHDGRFSNMKAIKNHQVFVSPIGTHLWNHRVIEQPLAVLWAAKTFYPNEFKSLDMVKEMQAFYGHFFHYAMSDFEAREILSGGSSPHR
jgi:iron complex transport system substrate-binding protein